MAKTQHGHGFYPAWVERMTLPVWVSSAQGTLCFMNSHARSLLDIRDREVLGEPCHRVIRSVDDSGRSFCTQHCPYRRPSAGAQSGRPVRLRLGGSGPGAWAFVLAIPIGENRAPWSSLVHCALLCEREHRIEEYLRNLTRRNPSPSMPRPGLTQREEMILERLAEGSRLRETSRELHVSYSTVRNHVQHILTKLDAHSIQEAVAFWLLRDPPASSSSLRKGNDAE